ncbi:hypothetical protein DDQ41_04325 [Streptomyces spongiicola]|uniref:Uncharacterized protein n=1 Tax=Streptomyces spongiicola TaxID=1690221 RepID=A0ABM6V2K9_9ACTN|nr:hypothetical protein [Streptomyces spongiicola]AWK08288.1 hypothetical protein DDQ41_04325 [Streptomyces spongiicola]
MEILAVHAVRGDDCTTRVRMAVGSEEGSFATAENTWTGVGESADEQGLEYMLVAIRSTK